MECCPILTSKYLSNHPKRSQALSCVYGGSGSGMKLPGRVGGESVGGIDGECTRLAEAISNPDYSVDLITTYLVGQGWEGAFSNLLLNLSAIVADSVTPFKHTYPHFANARHPTSW